MICAGYASLINPTKIHKNVTRSVGGLADQLDSVVNRMSFPALQNVVCQPVCHKTDESEEKRKVREVPLEGKRNKVKRNALKFLPLWDIFVI